jgi:phage terminase large subunit
MVLTVNLDIDVPQKIIPLFQQLHSKDKYRYNILKGGRGGGKSWGVALFLILKSLQQKSIVLCTREVQRTIKDSVHRLLSDTIYRLKLESQFEIQRDKITCLKTESVFIFTGLQNPAGIKSIEGITDCWIEEAAKVSLESWKFLIPTIRVEGSSFYIVFNQDEEDDPVNQFIDDPRPGTLIIDINYYDNPFFPDTLRQEMEYDKNHDYEYYLHVWEGHYWNKADDQVLGGIWRVEEFEAPEGAEFFIGADFGFSQDPSAGVRCFILDNRLYIDYECYEVGVINERLVEFFKQIPGIETNYCIADNSRPETIDYVQRNGLPLFKAAKKGKKSIEDGIEFIRTHEVIIHPRCENTIKEFKFYRYKKDIADNVTKNIIDKHNHIIDALRYALERARKARHYEVLR